MARTDIVDLGARRQPAGGHKLAERTWLDANGQATTDQAQGVTYLGPAGRTISSEAARLAGLGPHAEHKAAKAEADKAEEPKPTKRRAKSGDKARKASGDK